MDPLEALYHSDEILSEDDDLLIESNWRKLQDHSKSAKELLQHANAESAIKFASDLDAVKNTIINPLFDLEKVARLSGDINTVIKLVEEIIEVYFAIKDIKGLVNGIKYLMNNRGQSHQAQTAIISKAMECLESCNLSMPFHGITDETTESSSANLTQKIDVSGFAPVPIYQDIGDSAPWTIDANDMLELLLTTRALSHGKMHLELPYAQVSVILARICERKEKADLALRLLQKSSVERLSAVSKFDKTVCLIYQLSLALKQEDYIIFLRIVRRISRSTLEKTENNWLHRTYLIFLITYFGHHNQHFATFLCYWELFLGQEEKNFSILRKAIFHLILSPPESEEGRLESIEYTIFAKKYASDLNRLTWIIFFQEIMDESISSNRIPKDQRERLFLDTTFPHSKVKAILDFFVEYKWKRTTDLMDDFKNAGLANEVTSEHLASSLRKRFAEKNILVIAKYYTRITIQQLAEYADASNEEVEELVRVMVSNKLLRTKIDRVDQVVTFPDNAPQEDVNKLNDSVKELLDIVQETCHLIERERLTDPTKASV